MISAGRPIFSIVHAIVAVFPVPVAPISVWKRSPPSRPAESVSIAVGWSPVGRYEVFVLSGGTSAGYRPEPLDPVVVAGDALDSWDEPGGRRVDAEEHEHAPRFTVGIGSKPLVRDVERCHPVRVEPRVPGGIVRTDLGEQVRDRG